MTAQSIKWPILYRIVAIPHNGRGFEYTTETAGFGVQGMHKRARDVAATLLIITNPGHGTQVRVNANVPTDKIRRRILARAKQIFRKTLDNTTVL